MDWSWDWGEIKHTIDLPVKLTQTQLDFWGFGWTFPTQLTIGSGSVQPNSNRMPPLAFIGWLLLCNMEWATEFQQVFVFFYIMKLVNITYWQGSYKEASELCENLEKEHQGDSNSTPRPDSIYTESIFSPFSPGSDVPVERVGPSNTRLKLYQVHLISLGPYIITSLSKAVALAHTLSPPLSQPWFLTSVWERLVLCATAGCCKRDVE